MTFPDSGED